jgi:hypothetical protein
MITIEECRKILSQNGGNYSAQELETILAFLRDLADISLNEYRKRYGKSDIICPGIDR